MLLLRSAAKPIVIVKKNPPAGAMAMPGELAIPLLPLHLLFRVAFKKSANAIPSFLCAQCLMFLVISAIFLFDGVISL